MCRSSDTCLPVVIKKKREPTTDVVKDWGGCGLCTGLKAPFEPRWNGEGG